MLPPMVCILCKRLYGWKSIFAGTDPSNALASPQWTQHGSAWEPPVMDNSGYSLGRCGLDQQFMDQPKIHQDCFALHPHQRHQQHKIDP